MSITWEKRFSQVCRRIGPVEMLAYKRERVRSEVRARRGLPSGNLPADLMLERLRLKSLARRAPADESASAGLARLDRAIRHSRLLERKRLQRDVARRRSRPLSAVFYIWRSRREWLRSISTRRIPAR